VDETYERHECSGTRRIEDVKSPFKRLVRDNRTIGLGAKLSEMTETVIASSETLMVTN